MIVDRPALDWLTLTSYSMVNASLCGRVVRSMVGDVDTWDSKVMQYEGTAGDKFFVGQGEQKGKEHYMIRLSSSLADEYITQGKRPMMDCTRLDLQLTLETDLTRDDLYKMYRTSERLLTNHEKKKGQRERLVDAIIDGRSGECTIYVGNREGEGRFYRIYVKVNNEKLFNRFEVEFKGKNAHAGKAYRSIGKDPNTMKNILRGELNTLPNIRLIKPFKKALKNIVGDVVSCGREIPDDMATLRWINNQVMAAWKRQIGNEDTRGLAIKYLNELIAFRDSVLSREMGVIDSIKGDDRISDEW